MWPDCANDPTGLALLQGAKEHPLDTDRRLILADWLEDQDEPEVANYLRRSLREGFEWVPIKEPAQERWLPWNGCVNGWLGVRGQFTELPRSPWLCSLDLMGRYLDLGERDVGRAAVPALAAEPALAHVLHLDLLCCYIGTAGACDLASAPALRHLTVLRLGLNRLTPGAAQALSASRTLVNLTGLNLERNQIGDAGALALADSRILGNLTDLDLSENGVGVRGVQALATSPFLPALASLSLVRNSIGAAGEPALQRLRDRGVRVTL
jgi:uncharacterized protein (TIGR02996 family)